MADHITNKDVCKQVRDATVSHGDHTTTIRKRNEADTVTFLGPMLRKENVVRYSGMVQKKGQRE